MLESGDSVDLYKNYLMRWKILCEPGTALNSYQGVVFHRSFQLFLFLEYLILSAVGYVVKYKVLSQAAAFEYNLTNSR